MGGDRNRLAVLSKTGGGGGENVARAEWGAKYKGKSQIRCSGSPWTESDAGSEGEKGHRWDASSSLDAESDGAEIGDAKAHKSEAIKMWHQILNF